MGVLMSTNFLNTKAGQYIAIGGAAIGAVVFIVWYGKKQVAQAADLVGSVASGNNAVTRNQVDASGEKVTAYEGAGILGTLGAAFNSVSGGTLASLGSWLGGKTYDIVSWFSPGDQPDVYQSVIFPDGSRHAIKLSDVSKDGLVDVDGTLYRLANNSSGKISAVYY
jgi:hypothetical protein